MQATNLVLVFCSVFPDIQCPVKHKGHIRLKSIIKSQLSKALVSKSLIHCSCYTPLSVWRSFEKQMKLNEPRELKLDRWCVNHSWLYSVLLQACIYAASVGLDMILSRPQRNCVHVKCCTSQINCLIKRFSNTNCNKSNNSNKFSSVDHMCFSEFGTQQKIQEFLKSLGFEDFDNVHPDGCKVRKITREVSPIKNRRMKRLKQRHNSLWVGLVLKAIECPYWDATKLWCGLALKAIKYR